MLQEVHCSENTSVMWSAEWGYKTIFSGHDSARCGVAILFNNSFSFKIQKSFSDPNGRFIICDIESEKKLITIATVYAPNEDDPQFFTSFFDHLMDFECEEIVVGGDFNLVLNVDVDKKGGHARTHSNSQETLKNLAAQFDLIDAWRIINPDSRKYTWRRRRPEISCRLDFFLVSQSLMCKVRDANILVGYKTDHSLIDLRVAFHSNSRGPGFWKLNTSFLSEIDYVNQIRAVIKETHDEYRNDDTVNDALLWEMLKLKIREQSLKYAAAKKAKLSRREEELEKEINSLQNQIDRTFMQPNDMAEASGALEAKKRELEKIIEYRTKGSILRARCRWYNEGEKNTKYFLNLEKRHYMQGAITQLKVDSDKFITTDREILNHCEAFYRSLYTSKIVSPNEEGDTFFCDTPAEKRLNEADQNSCEGPLSKNECLNALKDMDCNKTPGSDGLPAEFYKVFWNDIADYFLKSINYAYHTGHLSVTQRRGIIKLIPKKDTEPYFVKNWRPISLLNCDYKIATKVIANRLKLVLPKVIDSDQTGFLKGRFIGENIRLIDSVINFTAAKNVPGLLLFLDFEKAFDTVEWSFIQKALRHYNFGPSIVHWTKLFYYDIESCILNNGWSSDFFGLERGVRQGCPLSPYLFILCAEVLADALRRNDNIRGITVNGQEIKISQYADDTTLILDGSRTSFTNAVQALELFSVSSGLRLNHKKTEVLWIGANKDSEEKFCPDKNFRWIRDKVKTLGVWLSTDAAITVKANYEEKLADLRATLSCWEFRRLTLLGKITVLKSLIISKLTYILSPLPTNHCAIEEINSLLFNFLWNGKGDKIKRDVMISEYEHGGLKMIDVRLFTKALKASWVKKYLDSENLAKWKLFVDSQLQIFGGDMFFKANLHKKDLELFFRLSDPFLQEIMQVWSEISYVGSISSNKHLLSQSLWLNSLIRVGNKPIYYKTWYLQGILKVNDLMENGTRFLSFTEFKRRYNIKPSFLSFYGLISAIKLLRKTFQEHFRHDNDVDSSGAFLQNFLKANKPNRFIYKTLVERKRKNPINSQKKWCADCSIEENNSIDWAAVYQSPFQCTKITKLRTFQFKLLHRRLATNDFLQRINLSNTNLCSFCQCEVETLIHLFWSCTIISRFWQSFKEWLLKFETPQCSPELTPSLVIGLKPHLFNHKHHPFLFLIARMYIWTCKTRFSLPRIEDFPPFLSHYNL